MKPLYKLAEKNKLGDLQLMDEATLRWLENGTVNYSLGNRTIYDIFPAFSPVELGLLKGFVPKEEWFLKKEHISSIHGLRHILRVLVFSVILSQIEFRKIKDVFLFSACLHDLRRMTDKGDLRHGNRASEWFLANQKNLFPDLNENKVEEISRICQSHDYLEVKEKEDELVWLFKAADALDRFRLPKAEWWPDRRYFKNENAIKLIPLAREFTLESEALYLKGKLGQEQAVFKVAKRFSLIK